MKETNKNPTIGQAADQYGQTKEAFQKRVSRAVKSDKFQTARQELGIEPDTPTGMRDEFTPALKALLAWSGREEKTVEPAKTKAATDKYKPVTFGYSVTTVQTETPIYSDMPPVPSPPLSEQRPDKTDKKPDTSTLSDRFFQSDIIVLSSLFVLILSDGFSMSLLSGRTFQGNVVAYVLFSIVGLIIGYAAISTTRAAYHAPRRAWEKSWAPFWIFVFAVFQTALHGSAFDLFGQWSDLVGRVLIVVSIPLATASLTTTILKQ